MIKAILFDLDETLHDRTGSLQAFLPDQYKRHEALAHVPVDDYVEMFLALDKRGAVPKAEVYPALLAHLGQVDDALAATMLGEYEEAFAHVVKLAEGAEELLLYLRQKGLLTGIITNGQTDHQTRVIYKLKLDTMVDSTLISEKEGLRKPDPEIFWRAASRLGLKPDECMFIGDSPTTDILGAADAGMATIWVPAGTVWPEIDSPANPGLTVTSLAGVLKMLVKIGV
jgi:putative hydrolase of the HAD superfamily